VSSSRAEATPRPGRWRRQPPDIRREQLLDAARQVLLDKGLTATTVADVAAAAGVAKGTLYLYFPSKDDLIAGLRARYLQETVGQLRTAIAGSRRPRTKLPRLIDVYFQICLDNRALHHLLFHAAGFSEDDAFATMRRLLADLVAEGVADGSFRVADPAIATDFLLAGMHAALVSALHEPERDHAATVAAVKRQAAQTLGAAG